MSNIKLAAKERLTASHADPTDGGAAFDMLTDGILDSPPEVQEITRDDGSVEDFVEQDLLNDDLPTPR
jgi:hypothetical protein